MAVNNEKVDQKLQEMMLRSSAAHSRRSRSSLSAVRPYRVSEPLSTNIL